MLRARATGWKPIASGLVIAAASDFCCRRTPKAPAAPCSRSSPRCALPAATQVPREGLNLEGERAYVNIFLACRGEVELRRRPSALLPPLRPAQEASASRSGVPDPSTGHLFLKIIGQEGGRAHAVERRSCTSTRPAGTRSTLAGFAKVLLTTGRRGGEPHVDERRRPPGGARCASCSGRRATSRTRTRARDPRAQRPRAGRLLRAQCGQAGLKGRRGAGRPRRGDGRAATTVAAALLALKPRLRRLHAALLRRRRVARITRGRRIVTSAGSSPALAATRGNAGSSRPRRASGADLRQRHEPRLLRNARRGRRRDQPATCGTSRSAVVDVTLFAADSNMDALGWGPSEGRCTSHA